MMINHKTDADTRFHAGLYEWKRHSLRPGGDAGSRVLKWLRLVLLQLAPLRNHGVARSRNLGSYKAGGKCQPASRTEALFMHVLPL